MNDSEGDDFVDVDSDSDSDMEIAPREANNQPSKKNASKLAAKQHERELLEKMRQAYAQNSDPVDLEEDEELEEDLEMEEEFEEGADL